MFPHRRDPYLWIHLAGLATVPLWLDVCLAGLAVGEPLVAPWLELIGLALVGALPILWMQLRRPFYIFSVPGLALRPDQLAYERRQLLTLQRGWLSRGLVLLAAMALCYVLYWLYQIAPIAADLPWLTGRSRATGWGVCAIAFFGASLFTLVPATVVPLFLTSSRRLESVPAFEATDILRQFTVLGLRVGKILPEPSPATESTPATSHDSTSDVADTFVEDAALLTTPADSEISEPINAADDSLQPVVSTDDSFRAADDDALREAASDLSAEQEADDEELAAAEPVLTAETSVEADTIESLGSESLVLEALPKETAEPPIVMSGSDEASSDEFAAPDAEQQTSQSETDWKAELPSDNHSEIEDETCIPDVLALNDSGSEASGLPEDAPPLSDGVSTILLDTHAADEPTSITSLDEVMGDQPEAATSPEVEPDEVTG